MNGTKANGTETVYEETLKLLSEATGDIELVVAREAPKEPRPVNVNFRICDRNFGPAGNGPVMVFTTLHTASRQLDMDASNVSKDLRHSHTVRDGLVKLHNRPHLAKQRLRKLYLGSCLNALLKLDHPEAEMFPLAVEAVIRMDPTAAAYRFESHDEQNLPIHILYASQSEGRSSPWFARTVQLLCHAYPPGSWLILDLVRACPASLIIERALLDLLAAHPERALETSPGGGTMLFHAVRQQASDSVVQALMSAAPSAVAVPSTNGETLLHVVRSESTLRMLLACDSLNVQTAADDGSVPLHSLAESGQPRLVQTMLEACPEAIRFSDGAGCLPLHRAVKELALVHQLGRSCPAQPEVVRILLEANASGAAQINQNGHTPLHCLLEGYDHDRECEVNGTGGLWIAESHKALKCTMLVLLAASPGVPQPDVDGRVPLHYSLGRMDADTPGVGSPLSPSLLRLLISAWPDAALHRDKDGHTPLDLAVASAVYFRKEHQKAQQQGAHRWADFLSWKSALLVPFVEAHKTAHAAALAAQRLEEQQRAADEMASALLAQEEAAGREGAQEGSTRASRRRRKKKQPQAASSSAAAPDASDEAVPVAAPAEALATEPTRVDEVEDDDAPDPSAIPVAPSADEAEQATSPDDAPGPTLPATPQATDTHPAPRTGRRARARACLLDDTLSRDESIVDTGDAGPSSSVSETSVREASHEPGRSFQTGAEDDSCLICMSVPKTHAFVPCGHVCACADCSELVMARQGACPYCRGPALMAMRLYAT